MFVEEKTQGEVPAKLDEADNLLLKAAAVIERQGWCQNSIGTLDGRVCLEGAINVAAGMTPGNLIVGVPALALRRVVRALGESAFMWNDRPERTKDEVVSKLRAVALGL